MDFQQGHHLGQLATLDDSKHWESAAFSGLDSPAPNCLKSKYLPDGSAAFSTNLLQPKCSQVRTAGVLPRVDGSPMPVAGVGLSSFVRRARIGLSWVQA